MEVIDKQCVSQFKKQPELQTDYQTAPKSLRKVNKTASTTSLQAEAKLRKQLLSGTF